MPIPFEPLIELYLDPDEADEFVTWAWGDNYLHFGFDDFMEVWNEKHGDKLKLHQTGLIYHDIPKMIHVWNYETHKIGELDEREEKT